MKLYKIFLILMLLFTLFGCEEDPIIDPIIPTDPSEIIPTIEYNRALTIVDRAVDYAFAAETLNVYDNSADEDILYVNIEEFLSMIHEGVADLIIHRTSILSVSIRIMMDETHAYYLTLDFNASENTLHYSDFNFNQALYVEGESSYETDLKVVNGIYTEGQVEKLIDLDNYSMDIIQENNKYYIPLYLANLLLTSDALNVYQVHDTLYIVDDFAAFLDMPLSIPLDDAVNEQNLIESTFNYTALFMDHFYGLKDFYNVDSYLQELSDLNMDEATSIEGFDTLLQTYIYTLDDFHTSIIDYGLNGEQVEMVLPSEKFFEFITDLFLSGSFERTEDFRLIEYPDYYILELNAFTLETQDLLKQNLVDLNPEKDIYIDLTCNTGGNLIAALELVSYMTNDTIILDYSNPSTGEHYTEHYKVFEDRALDNTFYVLTSGATFSAANLFVSIVKDMDLALIFGQHTAGGTAAVAYTVLPNQLVMSYSTNLVFTNQKGIDIQNGIEVDFETTYGLNAADIIQELHSLYTDLVEYTITDTSTIKHINLQLELENMPADIDFENYTIEFIDGLTDELIYQLETSSPFFNLQQVLVDDYKLLEIRITSSFEFMGFPFQQVIYSNMVDELTDTLDASTKSLTINSLYSTQRHHSEDIDFIQFEITEYGLYRFYTNGLYKKLDNKLYDASGTYLDTGNDFILDPGIYYLKLDTDRTEYNYSIRYQQLYDDNFESTEILLDEGVQNLTLRFDYEGDKESVLFTLAAESMVTVWSNTYFSSDYYIGNANKTIYNAASDYLLLGPAETFMLPAGTYFLGFHREINASVQVTINFEIEYVENDLSGSLVLEDENYGTLVVGDQTLTFDGPWDRDIYVFTTPDAVELLFATTSQISLCLITEEGIICQYQDESFDLSIGTHYFMFSYLKDDTPYQASIHVTLLQDLSNEDNPIPINIGDTFDVIIEKDGDEDFYTFSIPELTTLELSMLNAHSSSIMIYDAEGKEMVLAYYGHVIFQLPAGDYLMVIGEDTSELDRVEIYTTTLRIYETTDQDPNLFGLPVEYYRQFNVPFATHDMILGNLEYEGDKDYILINVTESGTYLLGYFTDYCSFYLVNQEGVTTRWESNDRLVLEVGIYYLMVNHRSNSVTDDYQWLIMKVSEE